LIEGIPIALKGVQKNFPNNPSMNEEVAHGKRKTPTPESGC
jgi:hypothetical protein